VPSPSIINIAKETIDKRTTVSYQSSLLFRYLFREASQALR
jgi:hypothetical protein